MSDLSDLQSAQTVKIIGQDSTGAETTPVKSSPSGSLYSTLRDDAGNEKGTTANPLVVNVAYEPIFLGSQVTFLKKLVLAPGVTNTSFQTIASRVALRHLSIGGRVPCEVLLAKYNAAAQQKMGNTGGFNSAGDVAAWTNTSIGGNSGITWSYATDAFIEGTGAAKAAFTVSDANDYVELTYNFATPADFSVWKSIRASVRVTVATGGGQTRTAMIRVTSGTAVRIYQIVGNTTTPPFNTLQWLTIDRDIESPDAVAGTGTFDVNNINSVSLRLVDGGNKSGTIWWDDARVYGQLTYIDKMYSNSGDTLIKRYDPTRIFEVGENLAYVIRNNSTSVAAEIQAESLGISIA